MHDDTLNAPKADSRRWSRRQQSMRSMCGGGGCVWAVAVPIALARSFKGIGESSGVIALTPFSVLEYLEHRERGLWGWRVAVVWVGELATYTRVKHPRTAS